MTYLEVAHKILGNCSARHPLPVIPGIVVEEIDILPVREPRTDIGLRPLQEASNERRAFCWVSTRRVCQHWEAHFAAKGD